MSPQVIAEIFEKFKHQSALIIGDVMIDSYIFGKVERISPEAPVPIVNIERKENRPGGAANVALNVKALGAQAFLVAATGKDPEAKLFRAMMEENGVNCQGLLPIDQKPTTIKTRVIGNNYQLLRIDSEDTSPCNETITTALIDQVHKIINQEQIDVIIFEDYDKGLITQELIVEVVKLGEQKNIPICVDPKKRNFLHYKNVDLFKPNLKEIKEGLQIQIDLDNLQEGLEKADILLKSKLNNKASLITLSERGVFYRDAHSTQQANFPKLSVVDVSGAGDTVISVASLCYAQGLSGEIISALSDIAGGTVCMYVGVVPIHLAQFYDEVVKRFVLEAKNNQKR